MAIQSQLPYLSLLAYTKMTGILFLTLALAHQGFAQIIETANEESTSNHAVQNLLGWRWVSSAPTSDPMPCPEDNHWWLVDGTEKCLCPPPFNPFPYNGVCYKPYRQGPCRPGWFVGQSANDYPNVELKCIPNLCSIDGLVPYMGMCYDIISQPINIWTLSLVHRIPMTSSTDIPAISEAPYRRICPSPSYSDNRGGCRTDM